MRSRSEIIGQLINPGIVAVVRAQKADHVFPLTQALLAGGVMAIEVTLTTPNAIEVIRQIHRELGAQALIGVGTVLDVQTCQQALEAGAQFVVSPILRPEIAEAAHRAGRPAMLGAYTPTEAQLAHEAGADFIKIFPADGLGPGYIKALRAPMPHLRIVPTGGIELTNAEPFIRAGCAALGVGSSLISPQLLQDEQWSELTKRAVEWVATVQRARSPANNRVG